MGDIMNFKKMGFFLLCFIVLSFSIIAVSANDSNVSSDVYDISLDDIDDSIDVKYLDKSSLDNAIHMSAEKAVKNNGDVDKTNDIVRLNEGYSGKFSDVQSMVDNAIAGDTIYLDNKTYFGNGTEIKINKENITISGATFNDPSKMSILDAKELARIFNSSAFGCTFKNLILINGNASGYGGAVYSNGANCSFINCCFVNSVSNNSGGAVFSDGDYCSFTDCCFVNSLSHTSGGAAVSSKGAYCNFNNCSFLNSTANYGGSVYSKGDYCSFTECSFADSFSIKECGGAVYSNGANCSFINCNFKNCNSSNYGGAIRFGGVNCSVNGCSFVNTSAIGYGGAVHFINDSCSFVDCSFINSSSSNSSGGAVSSLGNDSSFVNCVFLNNYAKSLGGAIYFTGDGCNVSSSIFEGNHALNGSNVYLFSESKFNLDNNYWAMNFTDKESFINSVFIAVNSSNNAVPNNWVLLGIKSNGSIQINKSSNFAIGFNKLCSDEGLIEDYDGSKFMDYNVTIDGNNVLIHNGEGKFKYTPIKKEFSIIAKNNLGNEVARNDFKINKTNTNILANNLVITAYTSKNITIKLKDVDGKVLSGKKLTITFNGKNYTRTTDSNGVVKLAISPKTVKLYKLTMTFAGDDYYNKFTKTVNITVKTAYVTVNQIIKASVKVKNYVNKNKKLPSAVTIGSIKCTIPQYSFLATAAIKVVKAKKSLSTKIKVINMKSTKKSTKVHIKVSKKRYLRIVNKLYDKKTIGVLPSYITVKSKKVGFDVYTFGLAKVLNFYNSKKSLPYTLNITSKY